MATSNKTKAVQSVELPLLPLRDVVVFPHMVLPLFVGRPRSVGALEKAMSEENHHVILVAQKSAAHDDPGPDDIYQVGVLANILQLLKLPDGTIKVLVEGLERIEVQGIKELDDYYSAKVTIVDELVPDDARVQALMRTLLQHFEDYAKQNKKIQPEVVSTLAGITDASRFADTLVGHLPLRQEKKQELLSTFDVLTRLEALVAVVDSEMDILQIERKIQNRVKKQMEKGQRDYYLNEQIKAIQKELGEGEEGSELDQLEERIQKVGMPKEAHDKAVAELKKLKMMPPMSAEATVVRNYIDTLLELPWKKKTRVNNSITHAEEVLDADHYGLEKVKDRILEYLAVQQRVSKVKSPILCLVGPPGVGKTSLGQSIARATNRQYVRMALGGVHDEAEIRGHRRTYIGAMPGKIVQNMTKAGVRNPLFLLDEIDKISSDFRGDPASALLEVLDPEQNNSFQDNYLEVEYDLSDVMFVATSNSLRIPPALLDRMEVIRLAGYTEDEKLHIVKDHLIPKLIKNNGLKEGEIQIDDSAVIDIVRYYTREAGVRSLEREISKICRKVLREILSRPVEKKARKKSTVATKKTTKVKAIKVDSSNLDKYLGVRRFSFGLAEKQNQVGQVTGLAWTEVGGDLLTIEAAVVPGKGLLQNTGSLGDVMKESMAAARTVIRSRAHRLGLMDNVFEKKDIHIHVPDGATPKDGPSAGIAVTTALVSAFSGIPVRADVAMTGEITLRGEVLAIGGLKEKLLAAHRGGIKTVLIPHENVKDLADLPDNVKNSLEIIPVRWIDEVLEVALEHMPTPLSEKEIEALTSEAAKVAKAAKVTRVKSPKSSARH